MLGAWQAGAFFVLSVSAYYLIKRRHVEFARASMKIGLVVAALKRALSYLDAALAATQRLADKTPAPVPPERLQAFRAGLFAVREEMLRIMNERRRRG